jgi:predicted O-linked N-acetylglucosamine transferase (SPINDLY family)
MPNIALQLLEQGKPQQSLPLLTQYCNENPEEALGWFLMGACNHQLNQLDLALQSFEQTLSIEPNHLQARVAQGTVLNALGHPKEALAAFYKALQLAPCDAQILFNIAVLLEQSNELNAALDYYSRALAQQAHFAPALLNRGTLLLHLGRLDDALNNNRKLVEYQPAWEFAHLNLGETLVALGQWKEALSSYEQTLKINPHSSKAHFGRGLTLAMLQRFDESHQAFEQARHCNPVVFGQIMQQATSKISGTLREVTPCNLYLLREADNLKICDWSSLETLVFNFDKLIHNPPSNSGDMSEPALLFRTLSLPLPATRTLELAKRIADGIAKKVGNHSPYIYPAKMHEKIRIGYVSPDFRQHPTASLTRQLYALHDRSQFEVHVYSLVSNDGSQLRREIEEGCDVFREFDGVDDRTAADTIYQDGIDILIDLAGYTTHARPEIFALRPAPLQLCYLGFPHTTGADFIDYFIGDAVIIPREHKAHFSEKIAYLPHSYFIFDNQQAIASTTLERASFNLPNGSFVFCCHNTSYKITPDVVDSWARILQRVPDSVLWLLKGKENASDNLRREANKRGIATDRLIFSDHLPNDIHLARYRLADLFLDTFHCNAHTTAAEALWAGLPVLTCQGDTMAARVASSLLNAIGLPELITTKQTEYEDRAVALATHSQELQNIRKKLELNRRTTPLFDTEQQVKNIEGLYKQMWDRHIAGLKPATTNLKIN